MPLPNAAEAVVPDEEVRDYLLSPTRRVGRFKAAFFEHLGFRRGHWRVLQARIRLQALNGQVVDERVTEYGRKYVVRGVLEGPNGRSVGLASIWIVRTRETSPRFVTAYPGEPPWHSRPWKRSL
jgi:hypothetical protein